MSKKPIKQGEMLASTTIRIEAVDQRGKTSTGTGFYYSIGDATKESHVPVIVTNKHVVRNKKSVQLVLTRSDEFGNRLDEHIVYKIADVQIGIIHHPDPTVDLCAITLIPIVNHLRTENTEIYTHYVTSPIIPTGRKLSDLDAIEEIIMIGYPNGLWDKVNNKPIIRRGITASDPKIDYNGKTEFLIDAACFPGSSGSPVFHLNRSYKTEVADGIIGYEVSLLGILYAGPTQVPINLGVVIKAQRLFELEEEIKKKQTA